MTSKKETTGGWEEKSFRLWAHKGLGEKPRQSAQNAIVASNEEGRAGER